MYLIHLMLEAKFRDEPHSKHLEDIAIIVCVT